MEVAVLKHEMFFSAIYTYSKIIDWQQQIKNKKNLYEDVEWFNRLIE